MPKQKKEGQLSETRELPPGVKSLRTLEGHGGQQMARPECFISYAWGDREQERWVERNLATDQQKAGIQVVLEWI